jgi:hypothetical protein
MHHYCRARCILHFTANYLKKLLIPPDNGGFACLVGINEGDRLSNGNTQFNEMTYGRLETIALAIAKARGNRGLKRGICNEKD